MAEYRVQDTSLSAIAEAIKAKAGTSDSMVFPEGFVEMIEGISVSGGGGVKFTTGTFIPAESTMIYTVTHGMGQTPDIVVYWTESATTEAQTYIFGANARRGIIDVDTEGNAPATSACQYNTSEVGAYFWGARTTSVGQKDFLNKNHNPGANRPYGAPHSADGEIFKIGYGKEYALSPNLSYRWMAIGGLV